MFVDILGFPKYEINKLGHVRSKKNKYILKSRICTTGYEIVDMRNNSGKYCLKIHRLLALTFIDNSLNKKYVDHIDRNKTNNSLDNLRWVTSSENNTNTKIKSTNNSGHKGVYIANSKYWCAKIEKNKETTSKTFPLTQEGFNDAVAWRRQKELELHIIT